MVTGVETASLTLAVLPILLTQLDNYVQGLETLKTFRAKRYLREMEGYLSNLGTQQAIFLNTLEHAVDGIVDNDCDGNWIVDTEGDFLSSSVIQEKLQQKFGRDYGPFTKTLKELSKLLEELDDKLGLRIECPMDTYWNDAPRIEREVRKFRHIFTKSVYSELLNRINSANTILSKLVEQTYQRATRGRRGISRRPLKRFRMARELAISLHKSIVRGNCWKCSCKDQHCVRFALDPSLSDVHNLPGECSSTFQFRMVFASKLPATNEPWDRWHEVEVESDVVPSPEPDQRTTMPVRPNTSINCDEGKPRVRFALATPAPALQSASAMAETPPKPILDICSTLSTVQMDEKHRELLGCLTDQRYRHSIYHLRDIAGSLQCLSLEEVISISPSLSRIPTPDIFIFSRRDRLRLSVILACNVLQLQGNWLKSHWRARDIMFPKDATGLSQPHILWDMANCTQEPSMCRHNSASAALIQSEILFPLGLILVELSLCQNLEALRTQDDDDAVPAYANLKTASRYLPAVEMESGLKYIEVVKRCLFWSGIKETTLEDGKMQEEMCMSIIVPLFENLKDFEGTSGIN